MARDRAASAQQASRSAARRPSPRAERHFWVRRSGALWRDLPARYGPRTPCYNRFVRWRKAGVWDRMMDAITAAHHGDIQMIDSTSVRAHQQAATARRGGTDADHCLGRSRGGLTTQNSSVLAAPRLPSTLRLTTAHP